jgi:hypothetical protein
LNTILRKNKTSVPVTIDFSIGHLDDLSMSLYIAVEDQVIYNSSNIKEKTLTFNVDMALDQNLVIRVDGKHRNDTKIDADGNILQDKFIRVDRVLINRMPVAKWMLESKFFQFENQQGQISTSNYFGQNGQTCVNFGGDLLRFFLRLNCKTS